MEDTVLLNETRTTVGLLQTLLHHLTATPDPTPPTHPAFAATMQAIRRHVVELQGSDLAAVLRPGVSAAEVQDLLHKH